MLTRHDDLLLSVSMRAAGKKIYTIPTHTNEQKLNAQELEQPHALWLMQDHRDTRQDYLNKYFI